MAFNQQIQYQDDLIKKQDELVDKLGDKVTELHDIALDINDEIDKQIPLLHDIDQNMAENQSQLRNAINRTKELIDRVKSNSCCVLGTIVFLVVLLIVLIMVLIYI